MKTLLATTALVAVFATHAYAENRELGAHEHGQGALNIAVEGNAILMEFEAPGADIVGFEYVASSADDRSAVDGAIAALAKPLELFTPPSAAGCVVTAANVALITEEGEHDEHGHADEHAEHGDEHAEHAEHEDGEHEDGEHHGHDEHADHAEEGHDEHGHGDEHADHDAHADEGGEGHTEFHAEYTLNCADPAAITALDLGYFERFPNAAALSVQLISEQGAKGFKVGREDGRLDLSGAI